MMMPADLKRRGAVWSQQELNYEGNPLGERRHRDAKAVCLISCSHWLPEGSLSVLVGRQGAMNPAGRVRCNIMPIARGYSPVSQPLF